MKLTFKSFYSWYQKLPPSNKAMVLLHWLHSVSSIFMGIFMIAYVYKINSSINDVVLMMALHFTWAFLWAFIVWFLAPFLKIKINDIFKISYIWFTSAFVYMILVSIYWISPFVFPLFFGFANWAFWLAMHVQELHSVKDDIRDFYSSTMSIWRNIATILFPLFTAFVFFVTPSREAWYLFMFCLLPLVFLSIIPTLKHFWDYTPEKIKPHDIKNFFNLRKNKFGHLFYFMSWSILVLEKTFLWVIAVLILTTEVNIWLYEWVAWMLSVFLLMHLSLKRNWNNRIRYMLIFSSLLALTYIFLSYNLSLTGYIVFSLLTLLIMPSLWVSHHVYNLRIMDSVKAEWSDFYPAKVLRSWVVFLWRIITIAIVYYMANHFELENEDYVKLGLVIIWFWYILKSLVLLLWEKHENPAKV